MAELASRRLASARVRDLQELDEDLRDEVLVFNKSCLQPEYLGNVLERLPALQQRARCLADPVDGLLPDEILGRFDGVLAASCGQAEYLASRLRNPVYLIHHHVDLRLTVPAKELSGARTAYFGELSNTWHVESLNDLVDFFSIDTTNCFDTGWAGHLPYYNVHYCLRRTRPADGFKPATKLFLAASLEAPVVVERTNDEARRLLPPDYPYFTGSADLTEVRGVLQRVAQTFGKDEWLYAKESMSAIDCYREDRILDSIEEMMRELG
ncbi:MAG: hypothetical protein R3D05_11175 [Dongiaceae bacterium]